MSQSELTIPERLNIKVHEMLQICTRIPVVTHIFNTPTTIYMEKRCVPNK